jgi:hypothetical protein
MKTGECYYLDEDGNLCIAVSYCNSEGETSTRTAPADQADILRNLEAEGLDEKFASFVDSQIKPEDVDQISWLMVVWLRFLAFIGIK